jgi:vacuolar-type H+-ATPase subunit E/Vma4
MTVDALVERITQDARARIAQLRAGAEAEVAVLAEAGARASARDRECALARQRAARRNAFGAELAAAQRRAAVQVLVAQHAFLDRVFGRAESFAADGDRDARYLDALPRLVGGVLACLGDRPATLRCRPALAAQMEPLLARRREVELQVDAALPAGFVVAARDGSCTIDCTLTARLGALRPHLEAGLLARGPR